MVTADVAAEDGGEVVAVRMEEDTGHTIGTVGHGRTIIITTGLLAVSALDNLNIVIPRDR